MSLARAGRRFARREWRWWRGRRLPICRLGFAQGRHVLDKSVNEQIKKEDSKRQGELEVLGRRLAGATISEKYRPPDGIDYIRLAHDVHKQWIVWFLRKSAKNVAPLAVEGQLLEFEKLLGRMLEKVVDEPDAVLLIKSEISREGSLRTPYSSGFNELRSGLTDFRSATRLAISKHGMERASLDPSKGAGNPLVALIRALGTIFERHFDRPPGISRDRNPSVTPHQTRPSFVLSRQHCGNSASKTRRRNGTPRIASSMP